MVLYNLRFYFTCISEREGGIQRLLLEVKQPPPDSYRHYKIGYMRKSFNQSPLFNTTVGGEWDSHKLYKNIIWNI